MSDHEWWEAYAPLLEKVFEAEQDPTAAHVGAVAGAEYDAPSDPARDSTHAGWPKRSESRGYR
jgi:hypothetical protein